MGAPWNEEERNEMVVEPYYGWRSWGLTQVGLLAPTVTNREKANMVTLFDRGDWLPHEPSIATCRANGGDGYDHEAPDVSCNCGYAALSEWSRRLPEGNVYGRVAMFGKVVVGTKGYRSEKAYPHSFAALRCGFGHWFTPGDEVWATPDNRAVCQSHLSAKPAVMRRKAKNLGTAKQVLAALGSLYGVPLERPACSHPKTTFDIHTGLASCVDCGQDLTVTTVSGCEHRTLSLKDGWSPLGGAMAYECSVCGADSHRLVCSHYVLETAEAALTENGRAPAGWACRSCGERFLQATVDGLMVTPW